MVRTVISFSAQGVMYLEYCHGLVLTAPPQDLGRHAVRLPIMDYLLAL